MIYLIDDKKLRQEKDYFWSQDRFKQYDSLISPIHTLEALNNKNKEIFREGNIILYHESFIDNTSIRQDALERRQELKEFTKKNNSFLVLFSGSKNTRDITGNIANIPVSVLYSNLESFIKRCSIGDVNLRYLLFGDNPEIEEELSKRIDSQLSKTLEEPTYSTTDKNLFIRPDEKYINQPLSNYTEKVFFDNVTDKDFTDALFEWMNEDVFGNIFIPLCFGSTLSDYNGLRLACHIRCTKTKNQTSRIYIYGIVGLDYLLHNEYFNILKTKNTFLIPFTKQAFGESIQNSYTLLKMDELPLEIAKLKLNVPQDYEDNHSIANEWAIYRWATLINSEDDAIQKITNKINSNLYLKYLQTIYPIYEIDRLNKENLIIKTSHSPKILYIDDEAEKGWYEIFCNIFYDVNKFDFDYLGDDFKNQTEEQIIKCCLKKIVEWDPDIVILDFRLHQNDFKNKDVINITGLEILKKIKKHNPGIQVIIFSASNKVWNLQALQDCGADNFIIKESPENSSDRQFTLASISNFIIIIKERAQLFFLKDFYYSQFEVLKELIPRRKLTDEHPLPKEFVDETLKWLDLSNQVLNKGSLGNAEVASSFIFKFAVLENISNRIIDVDNPIDVGKNENGVKKFKFQFRSSERRLRNFTEDEVNKGYYRRTNSAFLSNRNLPWIIKILNTIDFITNDKLNEDQLVRIVKKRNDLIHSNSTTGDKIEIDTEDLIFINSLIIKGLKNIV